MLRRLHFAHQLRCGAIASSSTMSSAYRLQSSGKNKDGDNNASPGADDAGDAPPQFDADGRVPLGSVPFQAPVSPFQKMRRMDDPHVRENEAARAQQKAKADKRAADNAAAETRYTERQKKAGKPVVYGNAARQQQRNEEKNEGRTPAAPKSDPEKLTKYKRSRDTYSDQTVTLKQSFAGATDAREITWWDNVWWNGLRYAGTRESLVGKDRYGNRFTVRWYFFRERQEERKVHRVDSDKVHQPYGALPTDSKLWESWMRRWRHDPPTPEEDEFHRKRTRTHLGVHVVGDEEVEDAIIRAFAHTKSSGVKLQELDNDEDYGKPSLDNTEQRAKENNPQKEHEASWTTAIVRGDLFYNEEETESMRSTLAHMFRDKEWQELELKRQVRLQKQKNPVRRPTGFGGKGEVEVHDVKDGEPMDHYWDRTDSGVPFGLHVHDLTTPELEKLKAECDALEEERIALRRELGLTDTNDYRENRPGIDQGFDAYQPPPTSTRWKPKCWSESWGSFAGGKNY